MATFSNVKVQNIYSVDMKCQGKSQNENYFENKRQIAEKKNQQS